LASSGSNLRPKLLDSPSVDHVSCLGEGTVTTHTCRGATHGQSAQVHPGVGRDVSKRASVVAIEPAGPVGKSASGDALCGRSDWQVDAKSARLHLNDLY